MIPVLGLPLLNRADLAARMLDSVDTEISETLVLLNGHRAEARTALSGRDITWLDYGYNAGVAASWNGLIKARAHADWWLLVNADIVFGPGDLEHLAETMSEATGPTIACLYEFGAFGINAACIDRVGWFDENLYPIYFEDTDYLRRCAAAGVPVRRLLSRTLHDNSSTIASGYGSRNDRTFSNNAAYFEAKWASPDPQTYPVSRTRLVANDWQVHP